MDKDTIQVAHPMLLKNWLLQKHQFCYENYLEKILRSLQSIDNLMMLLSSKFHVSELSLSKVTAVQSWTVQNGKSPQIAFLSFNTSCRYCQSFADVHSAHHMMMKMLVMCLGQVLSGNLTYLWKSLLSQLQLYAIKVTHYARDVRSFFDNSFHYWLGNRVTYEWPARSPDLTSADFFL